MQTFLPYPSFEQTAQCLDWRRCGKQRVEALQILNAIRKRSGWYRHAAVQMWVGYTEALKLYHNTMIKEWEGRGYRNNMPLMRVRPCRLVMPPWLGAPRFHKRMQARLLAKDPVHYGQFCWNVEPFYGGYVWPKVERDGSVTWRDLGEENQRRGDMED